MFSCNVLLADDHASFRKLLKSTLEEVEGLHVIGEEGSGLELLDLLRHLNPHLIILDISMPKMGGIGAARQLKTISPEVKILVLTSHEERVFLNAAISAGVSGYILKRDLDTDLLPAIHKIRQGENYFSYRIYERAAESDQK